MEAHGASATGRDDKVLRSTTSTSKKPRDSERPATPSFIIYRSNAIVIEDSDEELPPLKEIIQSSQDREKRELTPFNSPTKAPISASSAYSPRTAELLAKIRSRKEDDFDITPSKKRGFISISDDSDSDSASKSGPASPARPTKRRLFTSSYTLPRHEADLLSDLIMDEVDWAKLAKDVATNRGISFYRRALKSALNPPSAFDVQPRVSAPSQSCRPPLSTYEMRRLSRSVLAQVDFQVVAEEIAGDREASFYHQAVRALLEKKMKELVRREEKDL